MTLGQHKRKEGGRADLLCLAELLKIGYLGNISISNGNLGNIFNVPRSYDAYLSNECVFIGIGGCLCRGNFDRDLVGIVWHASLGSGTTGPNKPHFLLHEGKV